MPSDALAALESSSLDSVISPHPFWERLIQSLSEILNPRFPSLFFEKSLPSVGTLVITSRYWITRGQGEA